MGFFIYLFYLYFGTIVYFDVELFCVFLLLLEAYGNAEQQYENRMTTDLAISIFWTASESNGFGYNDILNTLRRWQTDLALKIFWMASSPAKNSRLTGLGCRRIWLYWYFEWPQKVTDLAITIFWTPSEGDGDLAPKIFWTPKRCSKSTAVGFPGQKLPLKATELAKWNWRHIMLKKLKPLWVVVLYSKTRQTHPE